MVSSLRSSVGSYASNVPSLRSSVRSFPWPTHHIASIHIAPACYAALDAPPYTNTQQDVSIFLAWAAEPEHDYRKKAGVQWIGALLVALALTGFYKRFRWSILKTSKFHYVA